MCAPPPRPDRAAPRRPAPAAAPRATTGPCGPAEPVPVPSGSRSSESGSVAPPRRAASRHVRYQRGSCQRGEYWHGWCQPAPSRRGESRGRCRYGGSRWHRVTFLRVTPWDAPHGPPRSCPCRPAPLPSGRLWSGWIRADRRQCGRTWPRLRRSGPRRSAAHARWVRFRIGGWRVRGGRSEGRRRTPRRQPRRPRGPRGTSTPWPDHGRRAPAGGAAVPGGPAERRSRAVRAAGRASRARAHVPGRGRRTSGRTGQAGRHHRTAGPETPRAGR